MKSRGAVRFASVATRRGRPFHRRRGASRRLPGVAGKAVLVTGAGKGIGLALATQLHAAGARLALLDMDAGAAQRAAEHLDALAFPADVSDSAETAAAVRLASQRLGGLDVVIANAGISQPPTPMAVLDPEQFERIVDVNLLGAWRTVQPALGDLMRRRGQIVLLGSVYSWFNGNLVAPYAASKAGVEQLGRALQVELAPWDVATTIAHFSFVQTDLVRAQETPVLTELLRDAPSFLKTRMTADAAAAAIVAGIERRAPRVIEPRWCRVLRRLEGLATPIMDAQMLRDRNLRRILVEQTPSVPVPKQHA